MSKRRKIKPESPTTRLKLLDKIVLALNIIVVLGTLLSYFAPSTDPRDFMIIAMLGFGYEILFILNIILIAYWLFRYKVFSLISLFTLLIGFNTVVSFFGFRTEHATIEASQKADFKIMAYNVNRFKSIEKNDGKPSQNQILSLIQQEKPDIISFEEYSASSLDSGSMSRFFKKSIGLPYHYFKCYQITKIDSLGNTIFSRFPIVKCDSVPAPKMLKTKAIFADLKVKNTIIRVYSVHLAPVNINAAEKKRILNGKENSTGSDFILSKISAAFILRSFQVSFIKRHMEKCPYPYIVVGDFNDTPNSFSVNELGEGLNSAFIEKGSGLGVSYYSKFPKLRIDNILAGSRFSILTYKAPDVKMSDHYPIFSDMAIKVSDDE